MSLAMPHIALNAAAFTNMKVSHQQRMQKHINSCTRFVTKTPRLRPLSRVRRSLNILTFFNLRKLRTLSAMHKVVYGVHSQYLKDRLAALTPRSNRQRDRMAFNIPSFSCDANQKSFLVQGVRAWNKLPLHLRLITQPAAFRTAIKRTLRMDNATRDRSFFF